MYRRRHGVLEVFLAHPGGPFWASKDAGAWTIPKGEVEPGDELEATALREFEEETGIAPIGGRHALGSVVQKNGKTVHAWAFEGDLDGPIESNTFRLEWPPRSGRYQDCPEIDRAEWFDLATARAKINPAQEAFLDRLGQLK